jgi:circadian clock protein KaiC
MTAFDKAPTGVPGLDALTRGGLPAGRATLVAGKSGTGKSILALQTAARLARDGRAVLYLAVEESTDDLARMADGLGFGASALCGEGRLHFVDMRRPAGVPVVVTGEYDSTGFVERVAADARRTGARAVVVDSMSALFHPRPAPDALRAHFFSIVRALHELGLTALFTSEAASDYGQPSVLGVEDYVCDLVLVLRNVADGKRRRRTIEVHKYRGSPHFKGEYPCTITDAGMTIFPLDALEEPPAGDDPAARFSSGLEGLDRMNAGGWLRDSIVLVRGPSGGGKTTLAGMYARAGARRGERVAYYGFEETKRILLRNFAALGLPVDDLVAAGALRVACRYPEATSTEDLLVDLRRDLDTFRPSLIVLDSISSIEHSTSAEGFRTFLIGLASLLRERGRSALLTQTVRSRGEGAQDPPFLSTVADAIVMLNYAADAPRLERTMRVLKMRGSAHDSEQRRLAIGPGGLSVESPPAP